MLRRALLHVACATALAACTPHAGPGPAAPSTMTDSDTRASVAPASASPIDFARIAAFPTPGWHVPRLVRLSPDGATLTFLASESHSPEMALHALDLASGTTKVLLRAGDLGKTDKPLSREEELRRERQRKRIKGITGYQWAKNKPVMLIPAGGNVHVRGADGKVRQITDTPEAEIDPQLSHDGAQVAFVRGQELWVAPTAGGAAEALTKDAPKGTTRGQSDFNGQEEFSEAHGFWWSPTGERIAFLEVDESAVGSIPVMGYRQGSDLQMHRYPRAGTKNPKTRVAIVDVATKATRFITMPASEDFDADDQYVGRFHWSPDGAVLYFQRLSRSQQKLALVRVDAKTGEAKHIVSESDPNWLDMSAMAVCADGHLVWTGLRAGHRHLERRDGVSGKVISTLTKGDWDVSRIVGVSDSTKRVVFVANENAVLDRQVYRVGFDGGAPERLTPEPGVHEVAGRQVDKGFFDVHSAGDRTPQAVWRDADGKAKARLEVPLDDDFERLKIRTPERVVVAREGKPDLHGLVLKPRHLQPGKKHPAIVMVYGGPGVQVIRNEYQARLIWQHLADRGFFVFQIDNRGSTGRGHDFETPIREKLGEVELEDQLAGLAHLSTIDGVDPERVGIYGHSYGGYMTLKALLEAPGRFKVGVSGSPVTDWRFYDTGYTERFMNTPQNNASGYAATDLTQHAGKLQDKLLVVHALMDENVHFEHTAKLIDAFVAADKDFDMLVFPGERHGYRSPKARRYAYRRVVEYFAQHL